MLGQSKRWEKREDTLSARAGKSKEGSSNFTRDAIAVKGQGTTSTSGKGIKFKSFSSQGREVWNDSRGGGAAVPPPGCKKRLFEGVGKSCTLRGVNGGGGLALPLGGA